MTCFRPTQLCGGRPTVRGVDRRSENHSLFYFWSTPTLFFSCAVVVESYSIYEIRPI
ncbi:hypothetical protein [Globicatella sanguinis]